MKKSNKRKSSAVWLVVLILFICVAATTMAFLSRLDNFLLDDSGAISLMGDSDKDNQSSATQSGSENAGSDSQQGNKKPTNTGFEASDDNTVWSTNTKVEIFRISYENGEKVVTVHNTIWDGEALLDESVFAENGYEFRPPLWDLFVPHRSYVAWGHDLVLFFVRSKNMHLFRIRQFTST